MADTGDMRTLPCPFCGLQPDVSEENGVIVIYCEQCYKVHGRTVGCIGDDMQDTIARWNVRVS